MFIALYTADGTPISVSEPDKLIGMTFNKRYFRKQFPGSGSYWFVWDCGSNDQRGSGFYLISVYNLSEECQVSYANHAASYAHFDLEQAIAVHKDERPHAGIIMPPNVEALIRDHVRYYEGTDLETEDANRHAVQTRPAADIAQALHKLTGKDATTFGEDYGSRMVPIFELGTGLSFFLDENGVPERLYSACLRATVPFRHRLRLWRLTIRLGHALENQ